MCLARSWCFALLGSSLYFYSSATQSSPPDTVNQSGHYAEELSSLLPGIMEQASIPGVSITVIESGELSWSQGFGVTDRISNRLIKADTLFQAASLSKPIFADIVLKLAEQGKIDLDAALIHYLPNLRIKNLKYAEKLTARLVLSHQTGLPNWSQGELQFLSEPGTLFGYSGEAYVYLQKVVEKISGLSLQKLATRLIFAPLKMSHSTFCWEGENDSVHSTGHNRLGKPSISIRDCENAASSLHTTAEDYARFIATWLNKTHLSAQNIEVAARPQIWMKGDERGGMPLRPQQRNVGWGLGWGINNTPERTLLWHWGDNDGFKAFAMFDRQQKTALVMLTNSDNGLSIIEAVSRPIFGDTPAIFEWLQYAQSSKAGWIEKQQGLLAEADTNYSKAIALFNRSLILDSKQTELPTRIEWLQDLLKSLTTPEPWNPQQALNIIGKYGPRHIYEKNLNLYYQRDNAKPYRLLPLRDNLFSLEGVVAFRIEFKYDHYGRASKLVGHYLNGQQDESLRDPSQ